MVRGSAATAVLAGCGLALLAPQTPARSQSADASLAAVSRKLQETRGYAGLAGVAHGSSIAVVALGERRPGRPHEADETFRWASVSKMITAIAVLQQVDDGRLELDTPLNRVLPDTPIPNADRITVRQLLAHRSGLAQQLDLPPGPPGDPARYCTGAAAEPGSAFSYNNCDTIILGKVLEAVTGRRYLDLVNARIAQPLGFTLTLPETGLVEARMPDGSDEAVVWPAAFGPSGGLYGRMSDLLEIDAP